MGTFDDEDMVSWGEPDGTVMDIPELGPEPPALWTEALLALARMYYGPQATARVEAFVDGTFGFEVKEHDQSSVHMWSIRGDAPACIIAAWHETLAQECGLDEPGDEPDMLSRSLDALAYDDPARLASLLTLVVRACGSVESAARTLGISSEQLVAWCRN